MSQQVEKLLAGEKALEKALRIKACKDFMVFVRGLVIPSASGPQLFHTCIADFQAKCFESLAPSLHAVRAGTKPPVRRFWIERTKKAGKDSDLACCLLWLMAFPYRPLKCQVCASDFKQAKVLRNRAVELVYHNPWLGELVEVMEQGMRNRKMRREVWTSIEATDSSGGAHGESPDVLVLNELVHVARWRAMEDHMANAEGVPRGLVIVSTNAGVRGTRAEMWRRDAEAHPERWTMHCWSKLAPWLSEEDAEEARRRDPIGAEYRRLWEGKWISGVGGALSEEEIDRCFAGGASPRDGPAPGMLYVAGLDLGVSHDHSGLVVLEVDAGEQVVRLAHMRAWVPEVEQGAKLEVDLMGVEEACAGVNDTFRPVWFGYDPAAGGSFMAQRLRQRGVPMHEMSFASPGNLTLMAKTLVQAVKEGKLLCYDDGSGRLRRDFGKFSIVHRPPSSYKLEAVSDEHGHADVGVALAICLPRAVQLLGGQVGGGESDAEVEDGPLEPEEVEAMPPELRDIYDFYDETAERELRREHWIGGT